MHKQEISTSLRDVRVKRGAEAVGDHHLVTASLQLKLKKCWKKIQIEKI
jgi:hypothetical protein